MKKNTPSNGIISYWLFSLGYDLSTSKFSQTMAIWQLCWPILARKLAIDLSPCWNQWQHCIPETADETLPEHKCACVCPTWEAHSMSIPKMIVYESSSFTLCRIVGEFCFCFESNERVIVMESEDLRVGTQGWTNTAWNLFTSFLGVRLSELLDEQIVTFSWIE